MTTTYSTPPRFYDDHVSRDLPGGKIVKRTERLVTVELTDDEAAELLSDAAYYVAAGTDVFGTDSLGLISSARATERRLLAAGVTAVTATDFPKDRQPEVGDKVVGKDWMGRSFEGTVAEVKPSVFVLDSGEYVDTTPASSSTWELRG